MSPAIPTAAAAGVLIEGPAPRRPKYTLMGAATVVPMGEDEHAMLGVALRSLPCGPSHAWDGLAHIGAEGETSKITSTGLTNPTFRGFAAYLRGECNTRGLGGTDWAARIARAFDAYEAYAVEREFWTGALLGSGQPSLAGVIPVGGPDVTVYPHGDTAVTAMEGLAALEAAIATSGAQGIIHCSPSLATMWATRYALDPVNTNPPTLQTINGNVVVPGFGYQTAAAATSINGSAPVQPIGHAAPTGTQEWAIATGQVEVRRSENTEIIPDPTNDALWQGVDRSHNLLAYEALRYYVVDWDTCFKAAVRVDRAT